MDATQAVLECETRPRRAPGLLLMAALSCATPAAAQQTNNGGQTGFAVKRPVLASACPNGCPWGELGDFVKEAMEPLSYEVLLCRNCNRDQGPPLIAPVPRPASRVMPDRTPPRRFAARSSSAGRSRAGRARVPSGSRVLGAIRR